MFHDEYITLETLSVCLALPQKFLRSLALEGEIPCLDVNGRLRFSEADVRKALSSIAQTRMEKVTETEV